MNDVEVMLNEVCHLVVALEGLLATDPLGPDVDLSLDTPQLGVLIALDLYGPLRPGTITELLGRSSGGTSKLLTRIEDAGLVDRRLGAVADDRRAVEVEITDLGRDTIRRAEAIVVDLAPALLAAIRPLLADDDMGGPLGDDVGAPHPGQATGSLLAQLYRMMDTADASIIAVVGDLEALHPTDPRALLVLSQLDRHGPMSAGEVPTLVGRSRAAASALVKALEELGLVERVKDPTDGRGVLLQLAPLGRSMLRGVTASLRADLPTLRPALAGLSLELGHTLS